MLEILIPIALGAVLLSLGLGLWNMSQGGSPSRSQRLMRWRVALQLIALVVVMTALFLAGR